jgi:hypothetical protein
MANIKQWLILTLMMTLCLPVCLFAQDLDDRTPVALLPISGSGQIIGEFYNELFDAVDDMWDYGPLRVSVEDWLADGNTVPFLSPSPAITGNAVYAITAEASQNEYDNWILRFYLWQMSNNRLLGMEWLEAYDPSESRTSLPYTLEALFGNIPPEPSPVFQASAGPAWSDTESTDQDEPYAEVQETTRESRSTRTREPRARRDNDLNHLWTAGASAGIGLSEPLLIATVRGTIAPFRNSFLELGVDLGFMSTQKVNDERVGLFSVAGFAHYAYYLPFPSLPFFQQPIFEKFGWYIGAGGGYLYAEHKLPNDIKSYTGTFIADIVTGFNILDMIDVSYTFRITDFSDFTSISKISVGYTYRFK